MHKIEYTGQVFGRLTAMERTKIGNITAYVCRCECGRSTTVRAQSLRLGETKSCGCARAEAMKQAKTTHGLYRSPTYNTWRAMLARCTDSKHPQWKHYGGRGISVCPQWTSFEVFLADMGERPSHRTLDRRDNEGNYEPSNCRWATRAEQAANKRTTTKKAP